MFKLKKEYKEYESKTLRLPSELISRLQKEATENNLSFNKAVIQCIEFALENMHPESEQPESEQPQDD